MKIWPDFTLWAIGIIVAVIGIAVAVKPTDAGANFSLWASVVATTFQWPVILMICGAISFAVGANAQFSKKEQKMPTEKITQNSPTDNPTNIQNNSQNSVGNVTGHGNTINQGNINVGLIPRTITPEQKSTILSALHNWPTAKVEIGADTSFDSPGYAKKIADVLNQAGWTTGNIDTLIMPGATGFILGVNPNTQQAGGVLQQALLTAGIDAKGRDLDPTIPDNTIVIWVLSE